MFFCFVTSLCKGSEKFRQDGLLEGSGEVGSDGTETQVTGSHPALVGNRRSVFPACMNSVAEAVALISLLLKAG